MSLNHLVETFNEVFVNEHHSSFRPFVLHDDRVSGLFGPLRIDSIFSPIRKAENPLEILGHDAHIEVAVNNNRLLHEQEIIDLLADRGTYQSNLESIVNFDRLARTVNILNYLTLLPVYQLLFLEVDPRHILGVKKDHGVYFQEFIAKAGLETANVVVVLTVYDQYANYYTELLAGLENYRQHGYQIALRFDNFSKNNAVTELISRSIPDYISLSAQAIDLAPDSFPETTLSEFTALARLVNSKTLLQQIDQKKHDQFARNAGFDLVEGGYYQPISYDYKINHDKSNATYESNL